MGWGQQVIVTGREVSTGPQSLLKKLHNLSFKLFKKILLYTVTKLLVKQLALYGLSKLIFCKNLKLDAVSKLLFKVTLPTNGTDLCSKTKISTGIFYLVSTVRYINNLSTWFKQY
jgi:hypothetical protein